MGPWSGRSSTVRATSMDSGEAESARGETTFWLGHGGGVAARAVHAIARTGTKRQSVAPRDEGTLISPIHPLGPCTRENNADASTQTTGPIRPHPGKTR